MTDQEFTSIVELLRSQHQASARLLAINELGPTVFLIDENHSMRDLINNNIQIARTLIDNADVRIVAVEGIEGDRITLKDLMSPNPDRCFGGATFATALVATPNIEVVGVDSLQLFRAIQHDCEAGKHTPANHPLEVDRSMHMFTSVLAKLQAKPAVRAAIVNGGSRHNDDIEQIVRTRIAARGLGIEVSVIRVRSMLYPTA